MTILEIVLGAMVVWVSLLWAIDQYRWAKREREFLDRIMAKHYQEYILAEDLRKPKQRVKIPPINPDILSVT